MIFIKKDALEKTFVEKHYANKSILAIPVNNTLREKNQKIS